MRIGKEKEVEDNSNTTESHEIQNKGLGKMISDMNIIIIVRMIRFRF